MYHPDSVVKLYQKILKDAGSQQCRIHPCHLHPCHEQGAGVGGGEDGKPAEAGTLKRKNCHSEPVRTLAWESPKVSGMSGGLPRAYGPRNDSFFLKNFPFGSNLGQEHFEVLSAKGCTAQRWNLSTAFESRSLRSMGLSHDLKQSPGLFSQRPFESHYPPKTI